MRHLVADRRIQTMLLPVLHNLLAIRKEIGQSPHPSCPNSGMSARNILIQPVDFPIGRLARDLLPARWVPAL